MTFTMVNYNIYETDAILYQNYNFDNVYKTAFANIFIVKFNNWNRATNPAKSKLIN